MPTDTILALSSAPGSSPRAILRLSGPASLSALAHLTLASLPQKFPAHLATTLRSPLPPVPLAALIFRAPHSFTGEDTLELHLPGSPALVRLVSDAALTLPPPATIRPATPGEFSARAFFNSKLDLTEAEGIAATIAATSAAQLRAAASLRQGHLHKEIAALTENLASCLASVEAGIDFTDEEDVRFIDPARLESILNQLALGISERLAESVRIDRLADPPTIAFIGPPNVGKSSLVNALACQDRTIVSPVAGTTRDAVSATMRTPSGETVRLLDLPGDEDPADDLRQKMMDARAAALLDADLIVQVVAHDPEAVAALGEITGYGARCICVQNKADLLPAAELSPYRTHPEGETYAQSAPWQLVSAKTGFRIPELRAALSAMAQRQEPSSGQRLVLNHRHRALLQEADRALTNATALVHHGASHHHPELLAADLRHALDLLGQITGTISPDDILGRIFSTFCIGK